MTSDIRCYNHSYIFFSVSYNYSIVGSRIIRSNSDYRVAVTTFDVKTPIAFRISIVTEGTTIKSEDVTLSSNDSRIICLPIGNIEEKDYDLVVEGLSGIVFQKKAALDYDNKYCSVLIQTDKSVYKPGDAIRYRVLLVDRDMKPLSVDNAATVYVCDGKANRIQQWSNVSVSELGVFEAELPLSTEPVLGEWTIFVDVHGVKQSKTFDVDKYVLPTYEVTVESPGYTFLDDDLLKVVINSKYTYGKPVVGELKLSVKQSTPNYGFFGRSVNQSTMFCQKVQPIDGKAIVEIDLKGILKSMAYIRELAIDAEVCETLTGRTQKGSTNVVLHEHRYNFRLIEESPYFPGLPYNAWVQVSHPDGSPVQDSTEKIEISLRNSNIALFQQSSTLDNDGMVKLSVDLDKFDFDYLSVEVLYRGKNHYIQGINKPRAHQDALMQANLTEKEPSLGKELKFVVACTKPLKFVAYTLLSGGELLAAGSVHGSDSNTVSITLSSTYRMVPRAKLLMHYISNTGYIVTSCTKVTFKGVFENEIHLSLSKDEVQPGESIDIDIRAGKDSYVGLLAVDQSVLLLKSGNDIVRDDVVQQLEQYESAKSYRGGWDDLSDCQDAGAVLLSNRLVPIRIFPEAALFACASPMGGFGAPPVMMRSCQMKMADNIVASVDSSQPAVRTKFPETWIWESIKSCKEEECIKKIVPDTITSWIITGFALSKTRGIGLVDAPSKINVFLPFFLSIDLPYSVKLGESVRIPVIVFNYTDADQAVDVVFFNKDNEFAFISDENGANVHEDNNRQVKSLVPCNSGKTFSFTIKPEKVGHITLKLMAKCPLAGDAIERQLLVEPEGLPQYVNKALLIDLRSAKEVQQTFNVDIPEDAVPNSTKVEISVIGDVLGSSIENLESLIRMPFGCGEQNMLNFVPCILVLDYLKACGRLSVTVESKAKNCMLVGYQRELTYKHQDGSFSAFGESDKSGSTWLTAFVAKSFQQAAKHITIEENVIDKALFWLTTVQAADGSFPEVGTICHKDMQGGSGSGIALTAYTVVAFLASAELGEKYKPTINKALAYIQDHISELNDIYAHSLVAYALQIADHSLKTEVLASLRTKAKQEGDYLWWSKPIVESSKSDEFRCWHRPCSVDVEMSAYGLLATLKAYDMLEGLPIMKWLVSQRNDMGGFQSTQDTVVGLQALAEIAAQLSSSEANISVKVTLPSGIEKHVTVDRDNVLVLQKHELPEETKDVEMMATGAGCALFQLSYKYNIKKEDSSPRFTLHPLAKKGSLKGYIDLSVSTCFIPKEDQAVSNMAVMEVDMPSGFIVENDTLEQLKKHALVKKVETKRGDTTVVLYFDNIGEKMVNLELAAFQKHEVENAKPANVIIYDYYDNTRCARSFYNIAA
ncbi:thioester-containing protein 1 allele R1-like [Anopheles nili]|uniref:thioester-containing protein 1 allele R1-like n=1 Tax=Anopheles nili TaxID=185578 RepID=UPI00237BCFBE|nr:thioester-containing protein 1 allele R1-like [Anopheles nili]